jgi:hypothetical protein
LSTARTGAHRKAHRARRVSPKGALLGNVSIMQDKGFWLLHYLCSLLCGADYTNAQPLTNFLKEPVPATWFIRSDSWVKLISFWHEWTYFSTFA